MATFDLLCSSLARLWHFDPAMRTDRCLPIGADRPRLLAGCKEIIRLSCHALILVALYLVPADLVPAKAQSIQVPPVTSAARTAWRRALAQKPRALAQTPAASCFTATYPSTTLSPVTCGTPPKKPYPPRFGPRGQNVGNGTDYSASTNGFTTAAEGTFPVVTGVSSLGTLQPGSTTPVANDWTLQLNTQVFQTQTCSGSSTPTTCVGWEQFVVENDGASSSVFIQYWLINYNAACPANWYTYNPSAGVIYCYVNSASATPFTGTTASQLGQMALTGTAAPTAGGGADGAVLDLAGTAYSLTGSNYFPDLGSHWQVSEYNVFGDCCSSTAVFNNGSAVQVQTAVNDGSSAAPNCALQGYTGELNNLKLVGTPVSAPQQNWPSISFNENNTGTPTPQSCATATSWGDTHIITFAGGIYDFQAAGRFLLFNDGGTFNVYANQVSGAPSWPNTSVNGSIYIQMNDVTVVVPATGNMLTIGGSPKVIANGTSGPYGTAQVQIVRNGAGYAVSDNSGNQVQIDQLGGNPNYVNARVYPGKSVTAQASGALVGPPRNAPVSFATLYNVHARTWHKGGIAAAMPGGQAADFVAPSRPFHATDLSTAQQSHGLRVCRSAGVTDKTLLDACVLDVTVIGNDRAADVYARLPTPKKMLVR